MADNPKSLAGAASLLGKNVLDTFKGELGDAWDNFSKKDKKTAERAAKRFAQLSFSKLQGKDVEEDLLVVEATLANLTYVESERVLRAFWQAVDKTVGLAATFLHDTIAGRINVW